MTHRRVHRLRPRGIGSRPAVLLLLFLLPACPAPPSSGPQPLIEFTERVTALVTTTTRGFLRDEPAAQEQLRARLPTLRELGTLTEVTAELRRIPGLEEMAGVVESDVEFELEREEHARIRTDFHTPAVQWVVVAAVAAGIERALAQLQGG